MTRMELRLRCVTKFDPKRSSKPTRYQRAVMQGKLQNLAGAPFHHTGGCSGKQLDHEVVAGYTTVLLVTVVFLKRPLPES